MYLVNSSAPKKSGANCDQTSFYHTQFECMSVGDRMRHINQRIRKSRNKNSTDDDDQVERCSMVYFSVDDKYITDVRHLIVSLCKHKLIFMRVKPVEHSNMMQVEVFVKISIVHSLNDLMHLRFNC